MAKLSEDELARLVAEQMPGFKLVKQGPAMDAVFASARPDAVTPDIEALRRAYLGDGSYAEVAKAADYAGATAAGGAVAGGAAAMPTEAEEVQMAVVEPATPGDAWDHGAGPKTIVVSGGRIIGSQG